MTTDAELLLRCRIQAEEITELRQRLMKRKLQAAELQAALMDALGAMDAFAGLAGARVDSKRIDEIRGMVRDG